MLFTERFATNLACSFWPNLYSHDFMFCARPFAANAAHLTETRPRVHDSKHWMLWGRRKKALSGPKLGVLLPELRCSALRHERSTWLHTLYGTFCCKPCEEEGEFKKSKKSSHDFLIFARSFAANAAHLTETLPRPHSDFKYWMLWKMKSPI